MFFNTWIAGLISKAYKHLEQEATSSYHTLSLETCENVTYESNSSDDAKFYNAFSDFEQDKDYSLLQRVSFETTNFLKYKIEDCCMDTILWYVFFCNTIIIFN